MMNTLNIRTRNVSLALPVVLDEIMKKGDEVGSRLGDRTKELLHARIALTNPCEREVLVPGRGASLPAQIAETMWVLAGRNDVGFLEHYLPRATDFSDDGETWRGGYGPRIRSWAGCVDQLKFVIELLRTQPSTRRAVIQIYDPAIDSHPGKDIPCNDWLHFISRLGRLDLHVAVRSNDAMWGWSGINAFEWSALLEIVAKMVGMDVGELHFSTTSLHVYDRHWAKADRIIRYNSTTPFPVTSPKQSSRFSLPYVNFHTKDLDALFFSWFELERVIREEKTPIHQRIQDFREPMLRSWLYVIGWYWRGDESLLDELLGTPLYWAALASPKRKMGQPAPEPGPQDFNEYVINLHAEKDKAYQGSWKKRGEAVGILANIARKIDRIGYSGGGDTATDTAIDLLVYLLKYRIWLQEKDRSLPLPLGFTTRPVDNHIDGVLLSDRLDLVEKGIRALEQATTVPGYISISDLEDALREMFEMLEREYEAAPANFAPRQRVVDAMLLTANSLARRLWSVDTESNAEAGPGYVNQD